MSKKILIVDDEPEFIGMVTMRLEANGYIVFSADNGQEGIDAAKKETPDLIFMDIMMPDMSGGDATRILRADSDTCSIPIVFLTAVVSKNEEEMGHGINIENETYPAISKPFNPEEFLVRIKEILGE